MLIIKKCEHCGIDFNARLDKVKKGLAKYCSKKCRGRAYSKGKRVELICPICGEGFNVTPGRIKPNLINYCSRKCYDIKQKGKIPWNKNKRNAESWPIVICQSCEKSFAFRVSSSRLGKFCSYKCTWEGRRGSKSPTWVPKIEKSCPICSNKFQTTSKENKLFCSVECNYHYHTGSNHPNYGRTGKRAYGYIHGKGYEPYLRDFVRKVEWIRARDNWQCQDCSAPQQG